MDKNQRKDKQVKRDALLGHLAAQIPQPKTASPCPDESLLAALAEGNIRGIQRDEIFNHLSHCSACRETYSLLRHLAMETPGRIRIFRPMALAASLVLVLLMVYVLYNSGTLQREEAPVHAPAAFTIDEEEPRAEAENPRMRSDAARSGREALPSGTMKEKGSVNTQAGAVRHDKVSRGSMKKSVFAPGEAKSMEKRESQPVAEETQAITFRSKAPAPAESRARPVSVTADSFLEKKKKRTFVSGISPEPPPAGTPPGRITVTLLLSADSRVSDLIFKPVASPLIPPLRRAFLTWKPPSTHMGGYLRFTASWNGREWEIQPSSTSGGKPPGSP